MLGKKYSDKIILEKPPILEKDGEILDPYTDEQAIIDGYKAIIDTEEPELQEGIDRYEYRWTEKAASIVKEWTAVYKPKEPSAKEKREEAYMNMPLIGYGGKALTCDQTEKLYYQYFCEEGQEEICAELKQLITNAKASIRAMFPDEEEGE